MPYRRPMLKNILVEITTTINTSGSRYIHHHFLKKLLAERMDINASSAPKLMMVVVRWKCWTTFSTRKTIFSNVVWGSRVCSSSVRPNIGTNCSLQCRVSGSLVYIGGTNIKITTAIADINPCNIERLSTTSIKPSRKKPSRNDISPDYFHDRPSAQKLRPSVTVCTTYLDCDNSCDSYSHSLQIFWGDMWVWKSLIGYLLPMTKGWQTWMYDIGNCLSD